MVLAEDIISSEDYPQFKASTMDGFAIKIGENKSNSQ